MGMGALIPTGSSKHCSRCNCRYEILWDGTVAAALGSDGVHPNNMHAELLKMFEPQSSVPKPLVVHLDFKGQHALQSLMLPHELFSALYHYYPSTFQKHFTPGGHEQVSKFWSKFAQHPSMEGHEIFALKNYKPQSFATQSPR
jgi:hypothetical protein